MFVEGKLNQRHFQWLIKWLCRKETSSELRLNAAATLTYLAFRSTLHHYVQIPQMREQILEYTCFTTLVEYCQQGKLWVHKRIPRDELVNLDQIAIGNNPILHSIAKKKGMQN